MAILIKILKVKEDHLSVEYAFSKNADWQNSDSIGRIAINKINGEYEVLKTPQPESEGVVSRVLYKLLKYTEANEFPNETSWA